MCIPLNGHFHRKGLPVGNTKSLKPVHASKQISTKRITKGEKKFQI